MTKVLIVGHGVVGKNLANELKRLKPHVYDKYKRELITRYCIHTGKDVKPTKHYDIAFICVDTPRTADNPCDTTEVVNAIRENDADIYVIKSTVLPTTTERLRIATGKRIVFSPEYYGSTQHANNYDFDFTILGGPREDCIPVIQALQKVYDGRHQFRITDSRTAELAKYMENSWIATKVSFCNQFFDLAENLDVCYEELRELFLLDERVNPSHTYVMREAPYWDSHCLNKDVPALTDVYDAPLLDAVIGFNEARKTQ